MIRYSVHESPFGKIFLAETAKGICELQFFDDNPEPLIAALGKRWPQAKITDAVRADFPVGKIFRRGTATTPAAEKIRIHLRGTNFQLKVRQALIKIPEAGLASYSAVAAAAHRARGCARLEHALKRGLPANPKRRFCGS